MRTEGWPREDTGGEGCAHAREGGLRRRRPAHAVASDFRPPGRGRGAFLLFEPPSLCYLLGQPLPTRADPQGINQMPNIR